MSIGPLGVSSLLGSLRRSIAAVGGVVDAEPYDEGDPRAASVAGRRAATRALQGLGAGPLTVDDRWADGRPRWPKAITGSITHSVGWAVAAALGGTNDLATRAAHPRCIGIDLERDAALAPDDAAFVLTRREQAHVAASGDGAATATILWSAKEAAFKAWSEGADGALPTVHPERDIEVSLDLTTGAIGVESLGPLRDALDSVTTRGTASPGSLVLRGFVWRASGLVLCAVSDGGVR